MADYAKNITVFEDTQSVIKKAFLDKTEKSLKDTIVYKRISTNHIPSNHTPITMVSGGTVETAYKYAKDNKVAMLNFANALVPGGLVLTGAQNQEENICRCTNLYPILASNKCKSMYYDVNKSKNDSIYSDNLIYSPRIVIFKDDKTYKRVVPREVDVITCPAPRYKFINDTDALNTYVTRIKNIILAPVSHSVDTLVLGAWGCGAFGQNTVLIARAFATVLNEYSGLYDNIVFAIRPTDNPDIKGAYSIFKDVFEREYKWGVKE